MIVRNKANRTYVQDKSVLIFCDTDFEFFLVILLFRLYNDFYLYLDFSVLIIDSVFLPVNASSKLAMILFLKLRDKEKVDFPVFSNSLSTLVLKIMNLLKIVVPNEINHEYEDTLTRYTRYISFEIINQIKMDFFKI